MKCMKNKGDTNGNSKFLKQSMKTSKAHETRKQETVTVESHVARLSLCQYFATGHSSLQSHTQPALIK